MKYQSVRFLGIVNVAILLAAAVVGLFPSHARAATYTKSWAAPVDGLWTDGTKWSPAGALRERKA